LFKPNPEHKKVGEFISFILFLSLDLGKSKTVLRKVSPYLRRGRKRISKIEKKN